MRSAARKRTLLGPGNEETRSVQDWGPLPGSECPLSASDGCRQGRREDKISTQGPGWILNLSIGAAHSHTIFLLNQRIPHHCVT